MAVSNELTRETFYSFLELYEEDSLNLSNYEQFKNTKLFLYVYQYVLAKKSLELIISKYLLEEDNE